MCAKTTEERAAIRIADDGRVSIDLGGAFDGACCGCASSAIEVELRSLGVVLKTEKVRCRLTREQRAEARKNGLCLSKDNEYVVVHVTGEGSVEHE